MNRRNMLFRLHIAMLILAIVAAMLTGCGGSPTGEDKEDAAKETTVTEEVQDANGGDPGDWRDIEEEPEIDITNLGGPGGVDVDLTKLSSTMVYAVVNDMLINPNAYIGKTVRMSGSMAIYHDEETDKTYYACIIKDALACCAQGMEFSAADETTVDDYPDDGEDLTVVGSYALYEGDGHQYYILKNAVLE